MKLLQLHQGYDTAGQSMASKAVLEARGDEVRVFVGRQHPFGYSVAPEWQDEAVRESWRWADVVVLHNEPSLIEKASDGSPKTVIVHHHGTRFRSSPDRIYAEAEAIGARQVVSTVDLLLSVPAGKSATWLPQVIDVERLRTIRATHRPVDGRIRVAHAPTNRMVKGTRHVTKAMRALRKEADYLLIQKRPWAECLRTKATADIFVDQLKLGYGNNAIEAWAMGLPVLASASPDILAAMRREFAPEHKEWTLSSGGTYRLVGNLPFFTTSPDTLEADLRQFIASPDLRGAWAEAGRRHVEMFHSPDAWAARAKAIYAGESVEAAA